MTTDMLITKTDGTYEAYSVKTDKSVLDNARNIEKLYIEKLTGTVCRFRFISYIKVM